MGQKEIICTVCPMGCRIMVTGEEREVQSVRGNACPRGEAYARNEFIRPVRLLTSVVKTQGSPDTPLLAVRTSRPVPRDSLSRCMEEIRGLCVSAPVCRGTVLCSDLAGTGVELVASADLE